jgi:transposase-like protein
LEVIAAKISKGKGNLECLEIILNVLEKCKNKPIFLVDGAPWYKKVLSRRGLKYEIRTKGKGNTVDSIFQIKEENEKLLQKISS